MSIDEPQILDAIGVERATDRVVLTIADHLDWTDDAAHLLALQTKLNAYLAFLEGGELIEAYPAAEGRDVTIDIVTRVPLSEVGAAFVASARTIVRAAGFELRTRVAD